MQNLRSLLDPLNHQSLNFTKTPDRRTHIQSERHQSGEALLASALYAVPEWAKIYLPRGLILPRHGATYEQLFCLASRSLAGPATHNCLCFTVPVKWATGLSRLELVRIDPPKSRGERRDFRSPLIPSVHPKILLQSPLRRLGGSVG